MTEQIKKSTMINMIISHKESRNLWWTVKPKKTFENTPVRVGFPTVVNSMTQIPSFKMPQIFIVILLTDRSTNQTKRQKIPAQTNILQQTAQHEKKTRKLR